jgi:hypothetical protein
MPLRQDRISATVTPALTSAFTRTISVERWKTYQRAAGFREELAHCLYLWNAAVGQSFHFPLQTAEVALRNVVHQALSVLYGPDWSTNPACRNMLRAKQADDILKAERRHFSIHGQGASPPQIVASLSLGFWVSMLRRDYNRSVWATQMGAAFPHLGQNESIADVSRAGTAIQDLRNRIFHQEPLIGHDLSADYGAILRMIGWICPETRDWTRANASVPKVIRERPR